jgi:hypothetical protein
MEWYAADFPTGVDLIAWISQRLKTAKPGPDFTVNYAKFDWDAYIKLP